MLKEEAIHSFWSSFALEAFNEISVPSGDIAPEFPYITYSTAIGDFGQEVALTASVWYQSSNWTDISEKAQEISDALPVVVNYDGGAVWLKKGSPFMQRMGDNTDDMIRRYYINVTAEYLSH